MTNNRKEIIKIKDLSVGYGKKVVVNSINQKILRGQFVCLLGPNGSGKTTILRTLARLLKPIKGIVYLKGKNLWDYSSSNLAKSLSVVLTGHLSAGLMTVFEFVAMGRYPYTSLLGKLNKKDIAKVKECLKLVHAIDLSNRFFNELSDGEKQKVIFARALAQEPDLIILDEPTVHLDLKHRIELISVLRESCKKKGITVMVSLHDVDLALRIADVVILVKNGRIIKYGDPDEVLNERTVSSLYDLNFATFNSHLGTIDIVGNNRSKQKVFVIGGGGTGVSVYRFVCKKNFSLITGIIHENDIDFFVARSLGGMIISEKPFSTINEYTFKRCLEVLQKTQIIIDSGFPVGDTNAYNLKLLEFAILNGKKVFSLRKKETLSGLLRENLIARIVFCDKITEIFTTPDN